MGTTGGGVVPGAGPSSLAVAGPLQRAAGRGRRRASSGGRRPAACRHRREPQAGGLGRPGRRGGGARRRGPRRRAEAGGGDRHPGPPGSGRAPDAPAEPAPVPPLPSTLTVGSGRRPRRRACPGGWATRPAGLPSHPGLDRAPRRRRGEGGGSHVARRGPGRGHRAAGPGAVVDGNSSLFAAVRSCRRLGGPRDGRRFDVAARCHDPFGAGAGEPRETTVLRQRQAVLEEVVRRCSRHAAGTRAPGRYAGGANVLAEVLGDRLLVEYAAVGPQLVAAVLDGGRCRLVRALLPARGARGGGRLTPGAPCRARRGRRRRGAGDTGRRRPRRPGSRPCPPRPPCLP